MIRHLSFSKARGTAASGVLACVAICAAGCANPFLANYAGERWPRTREAAVVERAPAPDHVRWIGHSEFDAFEVLDDAAAIAAARAVGADLVEWDDHSIGDRVKWSSSPVLTNQWDGRMFNPATPVRQTEYRYEARFYRSDALGGAALSGQRDGDVEVEAPTSATDATRPVPKHDEPVP